ncbi:DNA primase [Woeseia oceani]|uniref:DNA primase n=1 Tax=Woeseia oceani TaxID=1548547 RepID=A0A193LIB9_9GAMM|nr:DNA primase [Woeseia oceani]ANO52247.1 DNA primase [Woeseia oceani]
MSGLIPQHFIDDLIARADIVEVLGRRIPLKKAGREFKAVCPFHDEKTPSFTVSPHKGFYHCFGCGAHGTALGFLMEFEHLSFVDAVEALASSMGVEVPREDGQRPARRYDELYELLARVERHYQSELRDHQPAVDYLKRRDIDGATAKRYGIGYAAAGWSQLLDKFGDSPEAIERLLATGLIIRKDNGQHYDRFRERIMYPIRDSRGRCIGFGGRVMGDEEPKYLNSPETALFHKGRELYGLYEARQAIRHIERLVVVEGYMDVIGLARHGIDFAVATLGTATTEDHLNRLFRLSDDVFFSFDGDRAGRAAAWRALETALPHMREGRQIRFVFLPEGEDPDSFVQQHGTAAFEKLLDAGTQLSDFLINELASQVELTSVDGRARLAELAKPLLSRLPDGFYRELLTATLAETVGLSPAKLEALLTRPAKGAASEHVRPAARERRGKSSGTGKPSVIRRAITLLLHYPQAGLELDSTVLGGIDRPGAELLKELIESAQSDPDITTAGLLERWRHHKEGRHLGKLAATELPLGEDFDAGAELADCLHQLRQASAKARIENLIEKERLGALSGDQKQELRSYRRDTTSGG